MGVVACKDCVVCYIGYESRMEHEDAFFEALQVRSLASCHAMAWCLPTQGLVCMPQPDFHVLWFEVPEYPRAKLRQPELFGICMLVRKHAVEPVCRVPGPVCEEPGHRV